MLHYSLNKFLPYAVLNLLIALWNLYMLILQLSWHVCIVVCWSHQPPAIL